MVEKNTENSNTNTKSSFNQVNNSDAIHIFERTLSFEMDGLDEGKMEHRDRLKLIKTIDKKLRARK